jgi:hypothetical protein
MFKEYIVCQKVEYFNIIVLLTNNLDHLMYYYSYFRETMTHRDFMKFLIIY